MKRCAYPDCPTPDVILRQWGARKYHTRCSYLVQRARQKDYATSTRHRRQELAESPEVIEARFAAALVEIKRQPRELLIGWASSLSGLCEAKD